MNVCFNVIATHTIQPQNFSITFEHLKAKTPKTRLLTVNCVQKPRKNPICPILAWFEIHLRRPNTQNHLWVLLSNVHSINRKVIMFGKATVCSGVTSAEFLKFYVRAQLRKHGLAWTWTVHAAQTHTHTHQTQFKNDVEYVPNSIWLEMIKFISENSMQFFFLFFVSFRSFTYLMPPRVISKFSIWLPWYQ